MNRQGIKIPVVKTTASILVFVLIFESVAFAVGSKNAAYVGGTAIEFGNPEEPIEGKLLTNSETELQFVWGNRKSPNTFSIPYKNIIDLEYGQKAGRRVGVAIGTALLLSPVQSGMRPDRCPKGIYLAACYRL